MAIKFRRLPDGTLEAFDEATGEAVGKILTMGDMVTKDEAQPQ